MTVRITLLGAPSISRNGTRVVMDTRKGLALLAHLALCERPRSRDALCDLLWPEHDPSHARGALRRTLSTLRSALGADWVMTAGDSVALRRGRQLAIDVDRFRALAADGASVVDLAAAVALFRGDFLEGFGLRDSVEFDVWQSAQADALSRELASALRRLVGALGGAGDHERALVHARRWLAVDPLHEPAHRELIRLYALTGDRAAALEQYRACVRTLSRELGVAPLQDTSDLYEQVNDGRLSAPSLAAATPVTAPRAAGVGAQLPLVGRDAELVALAGAHAAASPDGRLAVIEGEAGIGKTRLFDEFASRARESGAVVLATRCHDDEAGLPYGPIVELLRAALRRDDTGWLEAIAPQRVADAALLLPELSGRRADLPAAQPLDGPGARVRLLEAVVAVLAAACDGPVPGIVFLDDVHSADEATIDAISYLARRLAARPLLLVATWRSEALPAEHRLRRVVAAAVRDANATIVRPARLGETDVARLVQAARPQAATAGLERRLLRESEGLPLFVVQYLAVADLDGGAPDEVSLPPDMQEFLRARLAMLSAVTRQVLGAAAAIGRSFDLATVREASGRGEEELVGALEELLAGDIVREAGGPDLSYDFSHQKLRALVYAETSAARRRLLHRRVAAAFSRSPRAGERATLAAIHLRLAGDDSAAAVQYRRAAEHAATLHAYADALSHLGAALALGDPDRAGAHERIGDLRTLTGDYAGALTAYATAAALVREGAAAARLEHKQGNVHRRRGDWERAERHLTGALQAADGGRAGLRAAIRTDLGHTLNHAGEPERAAVLAAEAVALAQQAADAGVEAQAYNLLGVLARGAGDQVRAGAHLERSVALASEIGDDLAKTAALNNLALVRRDAGELDGARELTERALALSVVHGDRHREAALENNLADVLNAAGERELAMTHLKRAAAIFADVGAEEAMSLPEIWKLMSW